MPYAQHIAPGTNFCTEWLNNSVWKVYIFFVIVLVSQKMEDGKVCTITIFNHSYSFGFGFIFECNFDFSLWPLIFQHEWRPFTGKVHDVMSRSRCSWSSLNWPIVLYWGKLKMLLVFFLCRSGQMYVQVLCHSINRARKIDKGKNVLMFYVFDKIVLTRV